MLEKEFKYYIDNQEDLVKRYSGKFLVIKNRKVIGEYNSTGEAYDNAIKTEALGTFLIQHCFAGKESYSRTFQSPIIIHGSSKSNRDNFKI